MKRIVLIMLSIFTCAIATAATETINWYMDGNTYATTTCQTGGDIVLPQTPTKYGYTFQGWKEPYTRIEYLESTGTQYIDTGIVFNYPNERLDYSFMASVPTTSSEQDFLSTESVSCGFNIGFVNNNRLLIVAKGQVVYIESNSDIITTSGYFLKNSFYNDYMNQSVSGTPMCTTNIDLFKWSYTNGRFYVGRTYFVKLKIDNVLVRDFIPVLDENNVPCMYDKVENKFYYNQGTGQFIAGPQI